MKYPRLVSPVTSRNFSREERLLRTVDCGGRAKRRPRFRANRAPYPAPTRARKRRGAPLPAAVQNRRPTGNHAGARHPMTLTRYAKTNWPDSGTRGYGRGSENRIGLRQEPASQVA